MAALLRERAALVNPQALSLIVNDRRADALSGLLSRPLPVGERLQLRGRAVVELANAGRPRDALKALAALEQDAREADPASWPRYRAGARLVEAMAYMRLAEDENCHAVPGKDACLLPINGAGVHKHREGGEGAVRALLEVLSQDPGSLRARWLLNIAHMTLGSYPDGVPERHRIPPSVFASEYPLAALRQRRGGSRPRPLRPRRRRRPRRLRRRRPARRPVVRDGLRRPDALPAQRGRRHVRGPHAAGRAHGRDRRPQHGPGGLRQRRQRRRPRAARRLARLGRPLPAVAPARATATAASATSRRPPACCASPRPRPRPGSTSTATAGSTCSSATNRRSSRTS